MIELIVSTLMLAAPAPDSQAAPAAGRAAAEVRRAADVENLDALERELNLSGDELARFRAKADAERAAIAEWKASDKGRELAALTKERAAASRARDVEKTKALWARIRPLSDERTKVRADARRDVLATLTPEQQQRWGEYVLFSRVMTDLDRVAPTDEQQAQIRSIVNVQAAGVVDGEQVAKDPFLRFLNPLRPDIIAEARDRVLTPEQNEKLRARVPAALTTRPGKAAPPEKE